jgi:hypothetical protein
MLNHMHPCTHAPMHPPSHTCGSFLATNERMCTIDITGALVSPRLEFVTNLNVNCVFTC